MENPVWEVARPSHAGPFPLGGFRHRTGGTVELRVVPHPAITVVLEFGDGKLLLDDGAQHGSFVAGLAPRGVRIRERASHASKSGCRRSLLPGWVLGPRNWTGRPGWPNCGAGTPIGFGTS
ncbi:hypothetical protein [Amycolatopsis rubida]|uniref:Uncharacterized protein n=1 Tax=Amycolatopsis rubida TaxID=112413 RepID=A0A1I5WBF2_9PSEU|nr:hypothetical protein [Amycolatopsis rubida]SFQ17074.1 hypothetical protein SAMN05421854_109146 [Amycolatopsis rubida]